MSSNRSAVFKILVHDAAALEAIKKVGSEGGKSAGKLGKAFEGAGSKFSGMLGNIGIFGPFQGAIDKLGSSFDEIFAGIDEHKGSFENFANAGKTALMGIAVVGGAVGLASLKLGISFQKATASLAASADIPTQAAQKIGNAFLGTAGASEFTGQEMMQAFSPVAGELENLTGTTLTTKQSMDLMNASSTLATASGESLTTTTKALVDVMLPFHMKVTDANSAANTLWNTQRLLGVSSSDLQSTYQRLTPFIAGSNMSFAQMSGLMVELSHSLGGGRQAARVAGRAIQSLIDPSSSANKALDAMNVSLFDAKGHFIGMGPALQKLKTSLANLPGSSAGVAAEQKVMALTTQAATLKAMQQTPAIKAQEKAIAAQLPSLKLQASAFTKSSAMQAIFGTNANAMLAVISGGAPEFNKYTKKVSQSGEAQSAAAKNSKTLSFELKQAKASVEDVAAKIGVALIPWVQKAINVGLAFGKFLGRNKDLLIAFGSVVGVVVVGLIGAYIAKVTLAGAKTVAEFYKMGAKAAVWAMKMMTSSGRASLAAQKQAAAAKTAADNNVTSDEQKVTSAQTTTAEIETAQDEQVVASQTTSTEVAVAGDAEQATYEETATVAETAGTATEAGLGPIGIALGIISLAAGFLMTHWKTVWKVIKSATQTVWHFLDNDIFHPLEKFYNDTIPPALKTLKSLWKSVWDGIKSAVQTVWKVIKPIFDGIMSAINTITSGISAVTGAIGSIFGGGGSGGGAASHALPHRFAAGGIVARPTLAIVGEAGPEAIVPLKGVGMGAGSPLPKGMASGGAGTVNLHYNPIITIAGTTEQIARQTRQMIEEERENLVNALYQRGISA